MHIDLKTEVDLKLEFRNYKLGVINNEINFNITKDVLRKNKEILHFITDNFPNDIISGSLALNIFGLLHRSISDIDILINDENRYNRYVKDSYNEEDLPNRLGYIYFKYKRNIFTSIKDFKVDFFINDKASFITSKFNNKEIKVHNPLEIIDFKMKMKKYKHNIDLSNIFAKNQLLYK